MDINDYSVQYSEPFTFVKPAKWEYKILTVDGLLEHHLNELGKEGWELTTHNVFAGPTVKHMFIFRRYIL